MYQTLPLKKTTFKNSLIAMFTFLQVNHENRKFDDKCIEKQHLKKKYASLKSNLNNECFCQTCDLDELVKREEDSILLSLPPCKALSIVLPGLDIDSASKCMPLLHNGRRFTVGGHKTNHTTNIENINCGKKIRINSLCNPPVNFTIATKVSSSEMLLKGKPKTVLPMSANGNLRMEENSISEIGEATTGTLSLSCTSSPISDECVQPDVDFELENDHCTDNDSTSITRSSELYSGGSQHSSLIESTKMSSVNNNQKIGVLKSLGRDSSTYLEDYLQLLTSRPPPTIQQKTNNAESKVPGKDEPLKDTNSKSQSRKNKTTINSSARSLGSNYLDNYLVNLTDYSWIIYPTETKSPSQNSKVVTFDLVASEKDSSKNNTKSAVIKDEDSNYLRRKLRFIDPDKFFNRHLNDNKSNVSEGSSSFQTNSESNEDKKYNSKMSIVADPATSPDISSSIFDQDIDDSCQKSLECTSLLSLNVDLNINSKHNCSDHSIQSDEMTEHHESDMTTISNNCNSSSGVISMSVNEVDESLVFEKEKISTKSEVDQVKGMPLPSKLTILSTGKAYNNEISEDSQILMASNPGFSLKSKSRMYSGFHGSGKIRLESNIEEESSSSSDISSATEPSTIVMAGDQHSLAPSDLEQSSLSSDLGKSIQDSKIYLDSYIKNVGKLAHVEAKCVYDIESNNNSKSTHAESECKSTLNLLEAIPNYERPNSSVSEVTQDDSLIESSESIGSVSLNEQKLYFLVEMLKARQQDEMNELTRRHDLEMHLLISNIKQLPEDQVSLLAVAYNSPNNNSLNELLDLKNIFSQSNLVSSTRSVTDTSNMIKDSCSSKGSGTEVSPSNFPLSNHTNTMPSFFLHENRQESGKNSETENSQISQIFSLSRARIQYAPQTITDILTQHPNLGTDTNHGSNSNENPLVDTRRSVSEPIEITSQNNQQSMKDRNDFFFKRSLEAGLDLVPARESDLASIYDKMLSVAQRKAICKLQAAIRGRIIRKLMMTSQVQKLLSTLKEVAILAHRFHHDILTDNIQKGDVDFHKALFNEEQQTRDKLNHIMVELSPAEQIKIIHRNQIVEEKEAQRKAISPSKIVQPSVALARSLSSKLKPVIQPTLIYSSKSSGIPNLQRCRNMKQISTQVILEPSRPCQVNLSLEQKKQCLSPRDRRSTSIPAPKPLDVHRCVPKIRTCNVKKSSEISKSHGTLTKNVNSHLCKSESVLHSYGAAKMNGNHRSPLQGDVCITRKPWR